jgi:hypothetical protein
MTRDEAIEDLEDLFSRQPDTIPREAALAIYGYLEGLSNAGILPIDDYKQFWDKLPLDGEYLAEAGVNL